MIVCGPERVQEFNAPAKSLALGDVVLVRVPVAGLRAGARGEVVGFRDDEALVQVYELNRILPFLRHELRKAAGR